MDVVNVAELRIGNYVGIIVTECYRKVDWHVFKFIIDEGDKSYKPIPLTEEWLIKFGFETSIIHYNTSVGSHHEPYYVLGNYGLTKQKDYWWFGYVYFNGDRPHGYCNIKNVHQLQNIYFDLTGSELTIKE